MSAGLQMAADRIALRDLVSRYALAVDSRAIDTLSGLFAGDAVFRSQNGGFRADGREAIVQEFRRQLGGLGPSFHVVHDQVVDFEADDSDRATGITTAHAEVWREGRLHLTAIRYHDRYIRSDGRWQFAERALGFLYYVAASDYGALTGDIARFRIGDQAMDADWPEGLESWRNFYAGS